MLRILPPPPQVTDLSFDAGDPRGPFRNPGRRTPQHRFPFTTGVITPIVEYRDRLRSARLIDRSFADVGGARCEALVIARSMRELRKVVARCALGSDAAARVEHLYIGPCHEPRPTFPPKQELIDELVRACVNLRTFVSYSAATCPLPPSVTQAMTGLLDLPHFGDLIGDTRGLTSYRATVNKYGSRLNHYWQQSITEPWQLDGLADRFGQLRNLELNHTFERADQPLLDVIGRLPCVSACSRYAV